MRRGGVYTVVAFVLLFFVVINAWTIHVALMKTSEPYEHAEEVWERTSQERVLERLELRFVPPSCIEVTNTGEIPVNVRYAVISVSPAVILKVNEVVEPGKSTLICHTNITSAKYVYVITLRSNVFVYET